MSTIRERLGLSENNSTDIRTRLGLNNSSNNISKTQEDNNSKAGDILKKAITVGKTIINPISTVGEYLGSTVAEKAKNSSNNTNNNEIKSLESNLETAQKKLGQTQTNLVNTRIKLGNEILKQQGIEGLIPTKEEAERVNNNTRNPNVFATTRETLENSAMPSAVDRQEIARETARKVNEIPEVKELINETNNAISDRNKALYELNKAEVENSNVTTYDKTIGRAIEGAKNNLSAFSRNKTVILDENGNKQYLPTKSEMWNSKVSNSYESGFGKIAGDIIYQGSKIGSSTALNAIIPGAGTGLYWTSMYSDSYYGAKQDGVDDTSAAIYATLNTAAEYFVGKALGSATKGLTGGESSEVSKAIKKGLSSFIGNERVLDILANAGSEGAEEFVQEFIDELNKKATLEKEKDPVEYLKVFVDGDTWKNAFYSAFVGGVTGGMLGGKVDLDETSINLNNTESTSAQNSNLQEQNTQNSTNTNVSEEITSNAPKNVSESISQDTQAQIDTSNAVLEELKSRREKATQKAQQERLDSQINNLTEQVKNLTKEIQNNNQSNNVDNSNLYTYEPTGNQNNNSQFLESAKKYGFNSDSEVLKSTDNLLSRRGINAIFDENQFNDNTTPALWTADESSRSIIINPNASKDVIFQNIVVHELTHDLISNKTSREALNPTDILDFIKKTEGYAEARTKLEDAYSKVYDKNSLDFQNKIDEEVIANVLGNKLGEQEFINRLVNQKPSIARQIYNWIIDRLNSLVNSGEKVRSERLYWENVKNRFETAYNMEYTNGSQTDTRYAKRTYDDPLYIQMIQKVGSDYIGDLIVNDYENYYLISKNLNNNYKIIETIPLNEENIEKVKQIVKEFKNDKRRKSISPYIEGIESRPRNSYSNNINVEQEETWSEFIDRVLKEVSTKSIDNAQYIGKNNGNSEGELDNSSFSLDKNEDLLERYVYPKQVYEVFKNEDKSKITKSIEELQKYKETLDPNTDDGWDNNFLANQQIDALESGFDNVYDYLVDREKTRLRQEADGKYGLGYKLIQDAIKQEEKNKQLQEDINNSSPFKNEQFKIIQETNPAPEESNYVWIRSPKDIKTFEEAINDEDSFTWGDYSKEDALRDLKRNKVRIYSSYAIKNGVFVSTSYQQALEYAGMDRSKVHSKEVNPNRVAWINGDEGQYASVTNISTNDDIRYSNTSSFQEWADRNFKSNGTKTRLGDIVLPTDNLKKKTTLPTKRVQNDLNEMNALKEADNAFGLDEGEARVLKKLSEKYDKDYAVSEKAKSKSTKAINEANKTATIDLNLNRMESKDFKNALSKYMGYTQEQLKKSNARSEIKGIIKKYSQRVIKDTNLELNEVQKKIRNTDLKVDEYLKKNITDYGDFRKSNFGKLKLGKDGISVDSFYEELLGMYPHYFDSEVVNDSDRLYKLAEFMNKDNKVEQRYNLTDEEINMFTDSIYEKLKDGLLTYNEVKNIQDKIDKKIYEKTRKDVQEQLLGEMGITPEDLDKGKDISALDMFRTDPIRLNEKVFGYETGNKINDVTIRKTKHNEAERTRFLNKERNEIKELGIEAHSKESAALQRYADGEDNYNASDLALEFPDVKTQEKIKNAAKVLRDKYDTYIDQINESLTDMGYDPIKKRKDYMRHFQALNDVFSKFGTPLNRESMQDDALPTDINGLTDQFKPGKSWFASAMQRFGKDTAYDAITGIDGYLEGASNLIYHTADIQRYRTLSNFIREAYGTSKGFEGLNNLTDEDASKRINKIFDNNLSKYAAWLDEQANALAGKKGKIDRGLEEAFGRKVYNALNTAKKQVGSNMTGFNVRSALTNFASAVQGASKTNKLAFVKGTISTIQNMIHDDGMINKSDFLTSRFGSDSLSKKLWQKISNAGQILMSGTDYFTANQIWRSKYFENIQKGMTEENAIKNADDFAARIMGDRSKGSTAAAFNSKTMGVLTQFQLEVNNQWSSLIHDNKMDIQSGNKTAASVLFEVGQLAAFSYFFNNIMKSLTGSDVMIDPIDLFKKIFAPDDDDKDKNIEERAREALGDLANDIPFASVFTGGRVPIGEAFKGLETGGKYLIGGKDSYGNDIKAEDVKDDLISSAFYWLLPTGYGQAKKTIKGTEMYNSNLILPGSYTKSGNLRFNADESTAGKIKAALFGQYSSEEAQKYINSGYKTISSSKIGEMKELGMSASEYRDYRRKLSDVGTTNEAKINYIVNSNYSTKQKNIMASNVLNKDFDLNEYKKYNSYDEYNYAQKNLSKYKVVTKITTYNKYQKYADEIKDIKANTTNDKSETIKYINSLNLSIPRKAMFIKLYYPSFNNYNNEIVNYINSQKISKSEKESILSQLGFTIKDGRVYW